MTGTLASNKALEKQSILKIKHIHKPKQEIKQLLNKHACPKLLGISYFSAVNAIWERNQSYLCMCVKIIRCNPLCNH